MKILIHDYPGHAFPLQLSRTLARYGHQVFHLYAGYNTTPRGDLVKKRSDPESFSIHPIYIRKPLEKYKFITRWRQENEYGRLLERKISDLSPDIIISANTPIDVQRKALVAAKRNKVPFIFWLQDILSVATQAILAKRYSFLGKSIGHYYHVLEKKILQQCDHIVSITEDFRPILREWNISTDISVIPNWAPIDALPVKPKRNSWAKSHHLENKFCFTYTGTLGMKHNPELLLRLAEYYKNNKQVRIVVVSEGLGADWLTEKKEALSLGNLIILGFQPFHQLPAVMGAADVLVAILQKDAGVFSVPSKILSYMCAKRPVLAAFPQENLSARIIAEHNAGVIVDPDDSEAFCFSSLRLLQNSGLRHQMGESGRNFAESHFDIDKITNKFLGVIAGLC